MCSEFSEEFQFLMLFFLQTDFSTEGLIVIGSRDEIDDSKAEMEASSCNGNRPLEQSALPLEAPKQDYIHVRARRGQATDSHSLAERVCVSAVGTLFLCDLSWVLL